MFLLLFSLYVFVYYCLVCIDVDLQYWPAVCQRKRINNSDSVTGKLYADSFSPSISILYLLPPRRIWNCVASENATTS